MMILIPIHSSIKQRQNLLNNIFHVLFKRIDAFVFPRLCIICNTPCPPDAVWLCLQCQKTLNTMIRSRPYCTRCGENPLLQMCTGSIVRDYPFSNIYSFVNFNTISRTIIHYIKYRGMYSLALYMGQLCSEISHLTHLDAHFDCIVPVPLHKKRKRKRGYNQAEWFAKGLQTAFNNKSLHTHVLKRIRNTSSQTSLDRIQRAANVEDAFACNSRNVHQIRNKNILLIDDVITTGATATAAAKALLNDGCKSVMALSFARD